MSDLDKLYSPSQWSRRFQDPGEVIANHIRFNLNVTQVTKSKVPHQVGLTYGPSSRQKFNIFGTDLPDDAPIFVFIHGGYWQMKEITGDDYGFIAEVLHRHQIKTVLPSYDLCPDISLGEMIKQIEIFSRNILDYAKKKNSKGVYFAGHSAGAHLVASLFAKPIAKETVDLIKGVVLISGVFDLVPLLQTWVSVPLGLDDDEAEQVSPQRQQLFRGNAVKFIVAVGEYESPEFIRQSRGFDLKLRSLGFDSRLEIIDQVDHFNIIELLAKEDFQLTDLILNLINKD